MIDRRFFVTLSHGKMKISESDRQRINRKIVINKKYQSHTRTIQKLKKVKKLYGFQSTLLNSFEGLCGSVLTKMVSILAGY